MMKRFLVAVLAVLCCLSAAFALASCDNGDDLSSLSEGKGAGNTSAGDIFYVKSGKTKIALGDKAEPILAALGAPNSVKELGDCAGLGAQVKYEYTNFNIYTLKNDSGETIDEISFTSDIAVTPKGICIGDDAKKVTDAYGKPSAQSEKAIIYTVGRNSLKFGLANGYVSSVEYVRAAQ